MRLVYLRFVQIITRFFFKWGFFFYETLHYKIYRLLFWLDVNVKIFAVLISFYNCIRFSENIRMKSFLWQPRWTYWLYMVYILPQNVYIHHKKISLEVEAIIKGFFWWNDFNVDNYLWQKNFIAYAYLRGTLLTANNHLWRKLNNDMILINLDELMQCQPNIFNLESWHKNLITTNTTRWLIRQRFQ